MTYHPLLADCVRRRHEQQHAGEPISLERFDFLANCIDADYTHAENFREIRQRPFPPSTPKGWAEYGQVRFTHRPEWKERVRIFGGDPDRMDFWNWRD